MNPDLDISIERVLHAPRDRVWSAWTDPHKFARWWIPEPTICRVERLEVRPGGALVTSMSEGGTDFTDHLDACFLVVERLERLVFTNAINSGWRPVPGLPIPMTAEVTMLDHPDGTDYRLVVRHGDPAARARHEELGIVDGYQTVTSQLARVVEAQVMT